MMTRKICGPLRANPANPRYFTDDSGRAVYLAGSHTWAVMSDLWIDGQNPIITDYDSYLEMMSSHNHNFYRMWQYLHPKAAQWDTQGSTRIDPLPYKRLQSGELANDGGYKFDLSEWDESYFDRLRDRIQKAYDKGIYVGVMLFEAWNIKHASCKELDAWVTYIYNPENHVNGSIVDDPIVVTPEFDYHKAWGIFSLDCPSILKEQLRFVEKVLDVTNEFDNVLYEICNEVPNRPESFAWLEHLCRHMRSYMSKLPKQHPIGVTPEGGSQDNRVLFESSADWISPSNGSINEYKYNPPVNDGSKVILNDTDHLWGHGGNPDWFFKSFLRGHNVLFMDPIVPIPGDQDWWQEEDITRNQPHFYQWEDNRRAIMFVMHWADRLDLNRFIPRPELCTSGYCLANDQEAYLCYIPKGSTEGFSLTGCDGDFALEWFDIHRGVTRQSSPVHGGERLELASPFANSSLVFIHKACR